MIKIIAVAFEHPVELRILCDCFRVQTDTRWDLSIIYDGEPRPDIMDTMNQFNDERIHFYHSETRNQKYGHPNRKMMLDTIEGANDDYLLMTNDDNYHVPKTVEYILSEARQNTGMIYWDIIHSHEHYKIQYSQIREGYIDMAAFAVRLDVAKQTGFNHSHYSADGAYAVDCFRTCVNQGLKIIKINKFLTVHN